MQTMQFKLYFVIFQQVQSFFHFLAVSSKVLRTRGNRSKSLQRKTRKFRRKTAYAGERGGESREMKEQVSRTEIYTIVQK
jgi:hypothetical protein